MADRPTVMVSSTVLDLPEHRSEVREACLRLGMFPLMMEHLPASDADAIAESIRMVEEADIYVGVFGYRYGYVPQGHDRSISEMEVDRAIERNIPRQIFFMADDHPVTKKDVETGVNAERLERLKERLGPTHIVLRFSSPIGLRANVIQSLTGLRPAGPTKLHYVSDIPTPPAPYIAHPYTLLQTKSVVGRQAELNLLTDWVAKPSTDVYGARLLSIVAVGGMGKSALTWKWFNEIAPEEMRPLAGRLWWSFYESDAHFENFVIRALAYATSQATAEIKRLSPVDREAHLLQVLDQQPFLLVLDGLERILTAYARPDAAYLGDEDLEDRKLAGADSLPEQLAGQHRLRKTADPRVGLFLQRLAAVHASRILVSTRLLPADLQTATGKPLPGSDVHFLKGLTDDDALALWRALEVSGSRDELIALFHSFGNYPLLIRALAGEVARYRPAPGNFDQWRIAHPDFDPFALPLVQSKSHVLAFALRGLSDVEAKVLDTIAAFRMPADFDTLMALLVGEDKPYPDMHTLDRTLNDLEDRGLLGWDRRANRYDLHPIVRGVAWHSLAQDAQRSVYETLASHFESIPEIEEEDVKSLDDLTASLELYNALVQLGRTKDAYEILNDRITESIPRLGAWRELVNLYKVLESTGVLELNERDREDLRILTAISEHNSGYPENALQTYRFLLQALFSGDNKAANRGEQPLLFTALCGLSAQALSLIGALAEAEESARGALVFGREVLRESDSSGARAIVLWGLARTLANRGQYRRAERIVRQIDADEDVELILGLNPNLELARLALWKSDPMASVQYSGVALQRAQETMNGKLISESMTLSGTAAVQLGNLDEADEVLHKALQQARTSHLLGEETAALLELARLYRFRNELDTTEQILREIGELTELASLRLLKAEALNLLTQLKQDVGERDAAVEAARDAYCAAWCDGPPFDYHRALTEARTHLKTLDAELPSLPRYEYSRGAKHSQGFEDLWEKAATDLNPAVRAEQLVEFAQEWALHPRTLPVLRRLAVEDWSATVRRTALMSIAAGWMDDPNAKSLLASRERDDTEADVRQAAHIALQSLRE